ncbi:DNA topoisomerase 2-like isoform X1 [Zingiber officinale]|uniref:DNA topoisomerase 2-like isoform X1 n=1 Tax=Zingiber officinale TaxID=94328 RepID=UPI001C4C605D|nr:DNA topoisomerase 2-like isoform X1 [Zingiber officinale]
MAAAMKIPLQSSTAHNAALGAAAAVGKKTIEQIYQKKTQLEHILLRPDTYIGSVEKHTQSLWVFENGEMVYRPVTYVPGLYKIFDEILVNAADNKQRDPSMDAVKVVIDVEANLISIYNNGDGVPIEIHHEEKVYVPELIFGHLLTSSNYDDNVKKTTGGRNGYGAKLANIFSTQFVIETADGRRLKKYKQVFNDNMSEKSEPSITKCKEGENWTKVTFRPDLAKFNMAHLEEDVVALMKKRVVDVAGTLGKSVKVELNGQRVPVKSFSDYVNLYLKSASKNKSEPLPRIAEKVNDRWEICVSLSEGQFQQVSFVNGIATIKGGTHVEYVTTQITNHIISIVNKKNKNANLKAHNVKSHLWVFVNALIDNPAFDSQTKETLTTRQGSLGSKCELSQDFLKKVAKSGVVNTLLTWADFKQSKELKKTDGAKRQRITGIPKLEDANDAGGRNSDKCTLILTEGDSAKALAMSGISVVGRNYYGVFPLRGKLLNVREANHKQIMDNAEIQNIKQILGLQHGKEYDSAKGLRYGHLMIMTDQDHDGSHIKGLLINFIHTFWPSLLKVPSFMVEFITPLLKATNNRTKTVLSFYSMPEFEAWKESLGGNSNGWSIKYYKGLGTSKSEEGKEYFRNIGMHKKEFVWMDAQDGESIELAFSKKKIEARKNWLRQFEPENYLDQSETLIKYSDFINKELILFSRADLQRSIPSMVDGLKPGQRKILFCAFKRNFVKQAKVAQFIGYVSENSAYHHGEQSLATTIIAMAQDFVGSNNINLLQPEGQFGTRHQGGKDHASARYIFTCLAPITRFLFPKDDDILLDYLNEDGQSIEPSWYMPIIPLVLVNGSEGIGTGWSSYIPNYNPKDIVANVKRLLNNEPMQPMDPWYRGFKGRIEKSATKEGGLTYTITGLIEEIDSTTLRVTELPVRRWTQDYKEFLESSMTGNDKIKEPFIKDYREHNDDKTVHFEVSVTEENMNIARQEGLEKKFKLTTTISTTNMHLFDSKSVIKKYDSPEQILEEFFALRFVYYEKRKKALLNNLELDLLKLDNKARFILGVVRDEIVVNKRKRADLFLELQQKGFTPFPKKTKGIDAAVAGASEEDGEQEESPQPGKGGALASDYDYLMSMRIDSLTEEKVQELCAQKEKLEAEVDELRRTSPQTLWLRELDALEEELDKLDQKEAEAEGARKEMRMNHIAGVAPSKQGAKKPRKNTANKLSVSATTTDAGGQKKSKKAPAKKQQTVEESDEDEEILALKDRLAAYNLDSSPDNGAMETDTVVSDQGKAKKQPSRNAAAKKATYALSSDEDDEPEQQQLLMPTIEEVDDVVEEASVKAVKGRKPKNETAKATRKRGPAQASKATTTSQKVRKMRASPFNKKSGSVLSKPRNEDSSSSSSSNDATAAAARTRPKRESRTKAAVYVESDSEGETNEVEDDDDDATEDSDFQDED